MAITKNYLKTRPVCKVTFTVAEPDAEKVSVVGDFNNWKPTKKYELKKLKNGNFKGTIDLEKDQSYQFRYLIDGSYKNEEQADSFAWNDFAGAENGVLEL
ncbi:glycoside hydrolase [Aureibaculum marinum]|uniref:Glycoside hydrolase n=1 Tax=Aureibaculum marinum TaxID=2487930 RepID=A0A3N4PHN6_9FLAO|nr:isoamylase early set domain-containing protein [Aureibaculum marinum]RPD99063.1 glycoside hydrolase [Aureibaculum marinum]